MRAIWNWTIVLGTAASLVTAGGCGDKIESPKTEITQKPADDHDHDHDHDHAKGEEHADEHPTEGPHGGELIELGKEEYHAEMVHDEKENSITIYVLDSAAKKAVPIAASEITINLKHDDKAEQFKLAAKPQEEDPEGQSSRFVSTEKELATELDHEHATATLVLTIAETQFRGQIKHDHDHEGHDHEGHDHDKK